MTQRKQFNWKDLPKKSSKVLDPTRDVIPDENCNEPPMTKEDLKRAERYRQRTLKRIFKRHRGSK